MSESTEPTTEPTTALVALPTAPSAPVEDEEPRVRIEQWASGRERASIGQMELLMTFALAQENAGHILDQASAFEQQFRDFCNAPVVG